MRGTFLCTLSAPTYIGYLRVCLYGAIHWAPTVRHITLLSQQSAWIPSSHCRRYGTRGVGRGVQGRVPPSSLCFTRLFLGFSMALQLQYFPIFKGRLLLPLTYMAFAPTPQRLDPLSERLVGPVLQFPFRTVLQPRPFSLKSWIPFITFSSLASNVDGCSERQLQRCLSSGPPYRRQPIRVIPGPRPSPPPSPIYGLLMGQCRRPLSITTAFPQRVHRRLGRRTDGRMPSTEARRSHTHQSHQEPSSRHPTPDDPLMKNRAPSEDIA